MTARHWIQVAAMASALGLAGTAIAQDSITAPRTADANSTATTEAPSAGAIIMPDDTLKRDDTSPRRSNDDIAVNPGASNDDMAVNPGTSNDDMAVNPGTSNENAANPGASSDETGINASDDKVSVPASGLDRQPGDMGPGNMRGE